MSLLSPLFLLGALAVAVPIVLHLFARESAPTVIFSTTRFIRKTTTEQVRRRWPRDLLLLFLRAAALILLALAFSRPYWTSGITSGQRPATVVVIDRSASLSAPDTWRGAIQAARDAVERAPAGHDVALVGYQQHARVILAPGPARDAATRLLDGLQPGTGPGDVAAGVQAASEIASGRGGGEIELITDLQDDGSALRQVVVPGDLTFRVATVPMPGENLALTAVDVMDGQVRASVTNVGPTARETTVRFAVDGRALGSTAVRVAAGATASVRGPGALPSRGVMSARVDDAEGIAADNERWVVLDQPPRVPVLIITASGSDGQQALYLERALGTRGDEMDFAVEVVAAASPALADSDALERARVIVLVGTRGLARSSGQRLGERVRNGCGLLVVLGPETNPGFVQDLLGGRDVVRASREMPTTTGLAMALEDVRHEVFEAFKGREVVFSQVRFSKTVPVAWQGGAVMARFTDGRAALVEGSLGRGRVMLFASDLGRAWNDWPVQASFVPWIHETARVLAGESRWPGTVPVGSPMIAGDAEAGVVALTGGGRRVAVNVPASEFTLDRRPVEAVRAMVSKVEVTADARRGATDVEAEQRQALWRYVLMITLMVAGAETLVAGRRGFVAPSASATGEER